MHTSPPKNAGRIRRRTLLAAMAGGALVPQLALAQAAAWPQQPIKMIIPYPPGGGGDGVGRPIAQGLERLLGVPVVLDHRPGAGGTIAAQLAANAPADGHTLYLADNGAISVAPSYRKLGYGPADFSYLAGFGELPMVLVANPQVPAKDLRELVAHSKTRPAGLSYASAGIGSIPHLAAELMKVETGLNAVHVAYKGSSPAMTDLISGVVHAGFFSLPATAPHIASGRLKALAVTSRERLPGLPSVPTFAELGYPSLGTRYISGILAPKGLPAPVSARLASALRSVITDPAVVKSLEATGMVVAYQDGAQVREVYEQDLEKWRKLIQQASLKLD
ncbi:Bug family tripartite tricarboxylate transporter substrate binding protein [Ramlibacter rhizophilus]|uniref:Tripartite tricarboxylate transporter substrate binding protein n=1 Tax=Ramlibacter rhizophilus TaxID=1781167 RepID=A0A4Z0BYN0_9BURK|nr:tripartite tricarboxylate transporter substrate binding protein [Ramlibacter rhizophilus]TFZ04447.1 tripartite tricarboxylate transporter substrate binding protein [Ramlibacter rhizophilus]